MNIETFKKQIEKELQKMNKEQIVFFAWLCAVRVLPFIGVRGNFDYWGKKNRKKYLYALFRVLDANNYYNYATIADADADTYVDACAAAADAAAAYVDDAYATRTYDYDSYAASTSTSTNTAIAAVRAAASAASAADASVYAIRTYAYAVTAGTEINIQSILREDIQKIQRRDETFNNDLKLYGEIWDNFQQALDKEGCFYWGCLYENIFKNYFELDKDALKRRMNVPKEIQEQGAESVAHYLEELEKEIVKHLNEARIIILGDKGAGKTCLARRLFNPNAPMTTDDESTLGVDITLWKSEKEDMNVHIWDFAGHVVTHAVHKFFLSERSLYILVYDGGTEERNRLEYWLNYIINYVGDSKIFILVNKKDDHNPIIPIDSLTDLKDKYPIEGLYTFSIDKDKKDLKNFRKEVVTYIKNNPSWSNQEWPISYFNVKKELEQRFAENKENEYINIEEFKQIARKNGVKNFEVLLKNLHDLGICIHYDNMGEFDTFVLNPKWISQGIYKIINWVHNQGRHSVKLTDFSAVFDNDMVRYPKDKHLFLFELMKRYELANETEKKSKINTFEDVAFQIKALESKIDAFEETAFQTKVLESKINTFEEVTFQIKALESKINTFEEAASQIKELENKIDALKDNISKMIENDEQSLEYEKLKNRITNSLKLSSKSQCTFPKIRDISEIQKDFLKLNLVYPEKFLEGIASALTEDKPIIIVGPSGIGKTSLLKKMNLFYETKTNEQIKINYHSVDSNLDNYDVLGGKKLLKNKLVPHIGIFLESILECIEKNQNILFVLDELTRGKVDEMFSGIVDYLNGNSTLIFKEFELIVENSKSVNVPQGIKMICAMNDMDSKHLYDISEQIIRRFNIIKFERNDTVLELNLLNKLLDDSKYKFKDHEYDDVLDSYGSIIKQIREMEDELNLENPIFGTSYIIDTLKTLETKKTKGFTINIDKIINEKILSKIRIFPPDVKNNLIGILGDKKLSNCVSSLSKKYIAYV